ncbi:MAG: hypothetical protein COB90_09280 [Hyphomicrobiales bacterium]|nr:MAG: hypothetical protein COB90_09280 [Hyphomicrobiales bacterium]
MSFAAKSWRVFIWVTSIGVALVSYRFLALGLDGAFEALAHQLKEYRIGFFVHVIAAPIALLIVPFQLSEKFRNKYRVIHRYMGRVYCIAILFAGVTGLIIAFNAGGGTIGRFGFGILAVLWLGTTYMGYTKARARKFVEHRKWMFRSFALTFAGVMLRVILPIELIGGMSFDQAYMIVAWACWVPNLVVVEYYLYSEARNRKMANA